MKFIYYPLVLLWLSIFGQVVLWFGQAKYTLYLSQGTSELKRKFLALILVTIWRCKTFKDVAEFKKWKNEEERMTKSWYVKHSPDRMAKHHTKSLLRCPRTGTFVSITREKRAMKSEGSSKTECLYPAFMITRKYHAKGEVQVLFETRWTKTGERLQQHVRGNGYHQCS